MLLDRWRARRAIATRQPPSPVNDVADPALRVAVEALGARLGAQASLGDPAWHYRWEGSLQLVGLDAAARSVSDVRQRLARLVHECDLRHLPRRTRRVLAVIRCAPREGEDLRGWYLRLQHDRGEVGAADWSAARRRIAVLLLDSHPEGGHMLFGGDLAVRSAVEAWSLETAAP